MIECLQLKRRNKPRRGDHQNLRPDPKIARLAWSPRFKNPRLMKKFLSVGLRRKIHEDRRLIS